MLRELFRHTTTYAIKKARCYNMNAQTLHVDNVMAGVGALKLRKAETQDWRALYFRVVHDHTITGPFHPTTQVLSWRYKHLQ